jgi:serine O-acetyltransferase
VKQRLFSIKIFFEVVRCFPHLMLFFLHRNKHIIYADVDRWAVIFKLKYSRLVSFLYLLSFYREYRNVFYLRVGSWKHALNIICPRLSTLYIYTEDVGQGLFIQHGFATIIAAKSIGENCWINQQVTIGYSNESDLPTIEDNVTINAGAKVIGKVLIENNSIVGANAVVVKNVPANCTVVGVPAYIVKKNGLRVNEQL